MNFSDSSIRTVGQTQLTLHNARMQRGISITGPPVDALITEAVISKYELEAKIRKEHSDDDDDDEPEWDGAERLGKLEDDLKKMNISWRTPGGMSRTSVLGSWS